MNKSRITLGRIIRLSAFALIALALLTGAVRFGSVDVAANHPVLVEGNCDSPVPGTTIVTLNTCGDYDGDGRIGTAEDTDGADRIFGTLNAALGPGTGAAAGTGANHNGTILIVRSGRFAETLFIGETLGVPGQGIATPGNVTIEAAPGVIADIDAVLQGDPAGGNTARQGATGITINYPNAGSPAVPRVVTLRNLNIRNWSDGVGVFGAQARVVIDNCHFENNLSNGLRVIGGMTVVTRTEFTAQGRRIGGPLNIPSPGNGVLMEGNAQVRMSDTTISHSAGSGIANQTGNTGNIVLFKVGLFFNNPDLSGSGATVQVNPNASL